MSDRDSGDSKRRRLDGVIPDALKRSVERAVERAVEAPSDIKQLVNDLRLPKEIVHVLFSQIDETKNGLFRVVAKEIRDFLEHANFSGELQKILTTVQFEVNTTIRFTPNHGKPKKPGAAQADGEATTAGDGTAAGGPDDAPRDPSDSGRDAGRVKRDERRPRRRTPRA